MGRHIPAWPKYALRITFGVIWLIDAVLKWLPGFKSGYVAMIKMAAQGQPGWLHPWFSFWMSVQDPHGALFAYGAAVLETLIAVALIFGIARKFTYISAALFSLLIWSIAEGLGGPYGAGSTDIGTSIIYALVFVCLLTLAAYTGTDRYSVDYYLEKRISWWWRIAEVGRPVQVQPVPAVVVPAQPAAPATAALAATAGPAGPMGPAGPAMPLVPVMDGARPEPVAR
jgi:nitrite reductase (NO-forming)